MARVSEATARKVVLAWGLEFGALRTDKCGCRYWSRPDPGSSLPLPARPRVSRRVYACELHRR